MRVAHVSDVYLPRTGGIESQVRGLSQAQFASGVHVEIFTATPARKGHPVIEGEVDNGVPIHRLAVDLPGQLPISPQIGPRLGRLLSEHADVIHVHGGLVSPFAWPALTTAVHAGIPAVVTIHSVWAGWSRLFAAANNVTGWRRWPVIWTTVSEVAAVPIRKALAGSAEVRILPNGIDIEGWHSHEHPNHDDRELVVISVARLAVRKRSLALIDMMEQVRKQLPADIKLRLLMVGDGPDRSKVERATASKGMNWVECVGWKSAPEIRELFGQADVFINPTQLESFGIAALEARTYGLPVVALNGSGVTEFIEDGQEGLLANDDTGLVAALVQLATDRSLLEKITKYNHDNEPRFGWPSVIATAGQMYRDAIELASGP